MARDLEDIYADAAVELGIVGPDRLVSAEDLTELTRVYQSVWHLLEELEINSWDLDGPIPDPAAIPLALVLAYHAAGPFGIAGDRLNRLAANGSLGAPTPSLGERLLRKLAAPAYVSEVTQSTDY